MWEKQKVGRHILQWYSLLFLDTWCSFACEPRRVQLLRFHSNELCWMERSGNGQASQCSAYILTQEHHSPCPCAIHLFCHCQWDYTAASVQTLNRQNPELLSGHGVGQDEQLCDVHRIVHRNGSWQFLYNLANGKLETRAKKDAAGDSKCEQEIVCCYLFWSVWGRET